jgi:hypothetical protein
MGAGGGVIPLLQSIHEVDHGLDVQSAQRQDGA